MAIFWIVSILQGDETCHFVLIAGQPIKEPIVQYGMYLYLIMSNKVCSNVCIIYSC